MLSQRISSGCSKERYNNGLWCCCSRKFCIYAISHGRHSCAKRRNFLQEAHSRRSKVTYYCGIFLHFFLVRHEIQLFRNERLRRVVVSDSNYQNCLKVKSSNVRSNKPMQHFTWKMAAIIFFKSHFKFCKKGCVKFWT